MIDYTLIHNRKGIIGKDKKALIQIRAYNPAQKKYKFFSTGLRLEPKQWDSIKSRVTSHHAQYIKLNNILHKKISTLQEHEISLIERDIECTLEILQDFNNGHKSATTFNDFVSYELQNSPLKKSTISQQYVFLNKLNQFNKSIPFTHLTYDFCCQFENFLIAKSLSQNSIHKEFKNFKRFVNLAIKKNLMDAKRNPFPEFNVKTIETEKIYLTESEIARFENVDLSQNPDLSVIRDIYLFGVYTGLRFGDIMSLSKSDLSKCIGSDWNLEVRMQKTEQLITLPLHKLFDGKPKQILLSHNKINNSIDTCFKNFTNQYINRELKVIAEMSHIHKRLTFHSSRHSFATSLINKNAPLDMIRKLMGHSKLEQTQEYAKLLNSTVVKELCKIW